jgi:ATP-dependent protease Clp ATPase subunit
MSSLAQLLRERELQADAGTLTHAGAVGADIQREFARVCEFLAPYHNPCDRLATAS